MVNFKENFTLDYIPKGPKVIDDKKSQAEDRAKYFMVQ